jgi:hypothetical protein
MPGVGQRFVAGDHFEQFVIDGLLAHPVKSAIQLVEYLSDVLLRALHGGQAAGIFAGQGFRAGLKQQHEEIFADESLERRRGS